MDNKQLITFWLDKQKHAKFKTKVSSIGSDITTELNKFIDTFIGKAEIKEINNPQPLPEPEYSKEED